jgi:hypothetical protein
MFVVSRFLFSFLSHKHAIVSNVGSHQGLFNRPISDAFTKSLGIKTENTLKAVVRLVNIFKFLAYDWTSKDDKTQSRISLDVRVSPTKKYI